MDDYKEKYENGVECIQEILSGGADLIRTSTLRKRLQPFFPELKENEDKDERIRKEIIDFVKSRGGFKGDWLAWLEKHGKQNPVEWSEEDEKIKESIKKHIFNADDWYVSKVDGKIHNVKFIEKQGGEKPTDKVEPKFHEGDFIVNDYCSGKIIEITNDAYLLDTGQGIPFSCEHNAHLWTIKDAKDGDVLVSNSKGGQEVGIVKRFIGKYGGHNKCFETYCYSDLDGTFRIGEYMGGNSIYPATQKQCAQLFHQMKEAGYEWCNEKKELKKIEQKPADKPKFKVGDWFVNNNRKDVFLIKSIDTNGYCTLEDIKGNIISPCLPPCESDSHIWTIEDANDGDVLTNGEFIVIFKQIVESKYRQHIEAYVGLDLGGNIQITSESWSLGIDKAMPATKEQRDLLFQKMKEAGYEWCNEKKELKKMEVVSKESEDERIREQLCDFLRDNMLYQDAQYFISWLEKQSKKKFTPDEVLKIRQELYQSGYNDGYKHGYNHGQNNIAIALGKESIDALEHFVRSIGESGYTSPYDNRTKLVYTLLDRLKQIVK